MTNDVTFGAWLKRRRKQLDLTQNELADALGCSVNTVRKIEQNSRRPSKQLTELMATALEIPLEKQDAFITFARTEAYTADMFTAASHLEDIPVDMPPLPTAVSTSLATEEIQLAMLSFLQEIGHQSESQPVFVGREKELTRLAKFLNHAFNGQMSVAFVAGETGQGKSSLLQAFARQAQEEHPDLVVATGICDVYTGGGDAFLPFRDVFTMLTGEIEAPWQAGKISKANALRLWELWPETISTLVTHGRSLINTLLSGRLLLNQVETYLSTHGSLAQELRHFGQIPTSDGDQGQFFADVVAVLKTLAEKRPLLFILDDLHWSDPSSISLLSHLASRLQGSPILIIGAYRPEDIAQQSNNHQHPLLRTLSDLKRKFGDIVLRLGHSNPTEARHFINELLDTEPNHLSEPFRQALAQHTHGHPLFTVELLRDLQARNELYKDTQGFWQLAHELQLEGLPSKVEGVIEKRIGRLDEEMQMILTTASVEGETFTAEVLANLHNIEPRRLIRLLSGPLRTEHRLVQEEGFRQVNGRRLTQYRFHHNLFQQYLYNRLSDMERAFQHEDVGNTLESLYGDDWQQISVKLARHFNQAQIEHKAAQYFLEAGNQAMVLFTLDEAIAHYKQGLEPLEKNAKNRHLIGKLTLHLGQTLEAAAEHSAAQNAYKRLRQFAQTIADPSLELEALQALIPLYSIPTKLQDNQLALQLAEEAVNLIREAELDKPEAEAKLLWNLSNAYAYATEQGKAVDYGDQAIAVARKLASPEQLALTLTDVGLHVYLFIPRINEAQRLLREANSIYRQLDMPPALAHNLTALSVVIISVGLLEEAVDCCTEAFEISKNVSKNLWGQAYSLGTMGVALREQGLINSAIEAFETSIAAADQTGFKAYQLSKRAFLAALYSDMGQNEKGLELLTEARSLIQADVDFHLTLILPYQVRLYLKLGDLASAEATFETAKQQSKILMNHTWYGIPIKLSKIELLYHQNQHDDALKKVNELIAFMQQSGSRLFLADAHLLKGQICSALGLESDAYQAFLAGKKVAEEIGSRRMLWPLLYALADAEHDVETAERHLSQAQEVIAAITENISDKELRDSFLNVARWPN